MEITYGGVTLAPGGAAGEPFDQRPTGRQVTDEAQIFRAPSTTVYGRGNKAIAWSFKVWRFFSTLADASAFLFLHLNDLPVNGDILIVCGAPDETPRTVRQAGAAVEAVPLINAGRAILVEYQIRGGLFTEVT
jgi:hypothetical protein